MIIILIVIIGLLILIPGTWYLIEYISLQRLNIKRNTELGKLIDKYLSGEITFSEMIEENKKLEKKEIRKQKLKKLNNESR
jgi:hypothetical protein